MKAIEKRPELKRSANGVYVCIDKKCAIIGYTNPKMLESLIQDLSIEYGASNIAVLVPDLCVSHTYRLLLSKYGVHPISTSSYLKNNRVGFDLGNNWDIVSVNGIWVIRLGTEIFAAISDNVKAPYRGRKPNHLVLYYLNFGRFEDADVNLIQNYTQCVNPLSPPIILHPEDELSGY